MMQGQPTDGAKVGNACLKGFPHISLIVAKIAFAFGLVIKYRLVFCYFNNNTAVFLLFLRRLRQPNKKGLLCLLGKSVFTLPR